MVPSTLRVRLLLIIVTFVISAESRHDIRLLLQLEKRLFLRVSSKRPKVGAEIHRPDPFCPEEIQGRFFKQVSGSTYHKKIVGMFHQFRRACQETEMKIENVERRD